MPADRTTNAATAARRSAFPQLAGVSPWFAVLIAISGTLAGFAIEAGSGHSELGSMFALCYALGCIAAVLLVRQSGLFTAVIQPPLLLFVAVPLSYFLLHNSEFSGLKGFLITCGYPLIERFPLMFFTTAAVLVIGLARWYSTSTVTSSAAAPPEEPAGPGFLRTLAGRLIPERRPRHGIDRSTTRSRPSRDPAAGSSRVRGDRGDDRSRLRQPGRRPVRDQAPPEPRRAGPGRDPQRAARTSEQRGPRVPRTGEQPPRRAPRERREPYPPRRSGDYEPSGYPDTRYAADSRRDRDARYRPREAYPPEPPRPPRTRQQPPPGPRPARDSTHHPVSRVRYRSSGPDLPDYPPRGR